MKTSEDYYVEALAIDKGREKARLLEKAAELAEIEGLEEKAFEYRYEFISALHNRRENIKTFTAFSWLLNKYDKNPEKYQSWGDTLIWYYKWILDAAEGISAFPLDKIKMLLDDYIKRLRKRGFSDYSAHLYSMAYYDMIGEDKKAEEEYQLTLKSPRDSHCDCIACVPLKFNSHLSGKKRYKEAWEKFLPIINGDKVCDHVPSLAWPEIALAALNAGIKNHREYYQKAWSQSLSNIEVLGYRSDMLQYIYTENLVADFRKFMLSEFNRCANTEHPDQKVSFILTVEIALTKFKKIWDKIEFCEGLEMNGNCYSSWQELYEDICREFVIVSTPFDERNKKPLNKLNRENMLKEALADKSPFIFELSEEAKGEVLSKAAPLAQPNEETFEEFCERYFSEIDEIENWQKATKKLNNKSADSLYKLIKDKGMFNEKSYAALTILRSNFSNTIFYPLSIWIFLFGEEWSTFGAKLSQKYRDQPESLKELIPDLITWPDAISEYTVKNFLKKCKKSDVNLGLLQQAQIWDKRDKNPDEIIKNLDLIKLKQLSKPEDKFEFAFLVKNYKSLEEAEILWNKIAKQVSGKWMASAYLQWGYSLSQLQEWEKAVEKLKTYLENCKKPAPYTFVELSWCLRQQGNDEEALIYANKAAKLLPYDLDAQMEAGLSNYALEKYKKSIKHFSKAHEIDKDNSWVSERYGLALRFSKQYKEAVKIFNRSLKSSKEKGNTDTAGVRFSIAMCRFAMGKSPAAEKTLISLIKENSEYTKISLEELRYYYLENGQSRKWDNLIQKLYLEHSKIEPVIYYYALFQYSKNNKKEAAKLLQKVKDYDEEYYYSLIRVYFTLENYKKICKELQNYEGYHYGIISLHLDSLTLINDLKNCRKVTERIKSIWPDNIWIMQRDCSLLLIEGKAQEAHEVIKKAIKIEPQPELYLTKLEVLISLKQKRGIKAILNFLKESERDDLVEDALALLDDQKE